VSALRDTMESNAKYSADISQVISLLPTLEEQSMLAWLAAAAALGKLGYKRPETIYALLVELESREYAVIRSAAAGLGKIGQGNRHVLRALKETTQVPDLQVMEAATLALQNLGHDGISIARKMLTDEGSSRANGAYAILERLVAQQTEEYVTKLPSDLPLAKEGEVSVEPKTRRRSLGFIAVGVLISTILGLATDTVATYLQEEYQLISDPARITFTIAVFLVSLVAATIMAWRS
jgi:hypothetical protein